MNAHLALTDGVGAIIAALVLAVGGVLAALLQPMRRQLRQINTAVNKVGDQPPLVTRVKNLETRQHEHRLWIGAALRKIGNQLGIELPSQPFHDQNGLPDEPQSPMES